MILKKNGFIGLDDAKSLNGKVLVHCQMGISRSPTIVIAYLMKRNDLTYDMAFNEVKLKRSIIDPNILFLSQLCDYERKFNEQTTSYESWCKY